MTEDDDLSGGADADNLKGGIGRDILDGGLGHDKLVGGNGKDILIGGEGDDILKGGNGADTFVFGFDDGSDVIKDFEDGRDQIDQSAFNFSNVTEALSYFYEVGTGQDGVVGFEYGDTQIQIFGADLPDITADDIII